MVFKSIWLFLLTALSFAITACDWETSSGEFENYKILDSKEVVLRALRLPPAVDRVRIKKISPQRVTPKNLEDLKILLDTPAISVTGGAYYRHITLKQGVVVQVMTNFHNPEVMDVKVGDHLQEVRVQVEEFLKSVPNSIAEADFVKSDISLSKLNGEDIRLLMEADHWVYSVPRTYSYVELFFANNRLRKATYHWTPFELP
ncbi:hypothetical protein [Sneathiella limimaris]|uniref:hypothetical protein n=1 Tax=Sneathiella limimaris TaxID=1964213 RepID=UPI00146EB161|nr:hypothetical protein [Sneathiella limimaris]